MEIQKVSMLEVDEPGRVDRLKISIDKIKELAESIEQVGLLQPVLLRPVANRFEIVAGHRRYLAHKLLGLLDIDAVVRDMTDNEVALSRAVENLAREDLTPVEEAQIYRNLIDSFGMTPEQVGKKVGKGGATVKRRLDILKMPESLRDAIHSGAVSMSVGEELWPISNQDDLEYYLHFAIESGCTKTTARLWRQEWQDAKRRERTVDGGTELTQNPYEPRPVFLSCDICHGAVQLGEETLMRICPGCAATIKENM